MEYEPRKRLLWMVAILVAVLTIAGCGLGRPSAATTERDVVAQVSIIDALLKGVYDGQVTCGELLEKGDLGIGTFDALDGEMAVVNGIVYRVAADGSVNQVNDAETTPFATITPFDADISFDLSDVNYAGFQDAVSEKLPSENLVYAVRVDGTFSYVKTRSVPRQEKPYPLLSEVAKKQPIFEMSNISGSLVGFWCPAYVKGMNVPGFHLHFLSDDRESGGHVLEFELDRGLVALDVSRQLEVLLPAGDDFLASDLSEDLSRDLHAVEQDRK